MKKTLLQVSTLFVLTIFTFSSAIAQDGSAKATEQEKEEEGKVRFNGLGRANLSQTSIGGPVLDNDTTTARSLTDGEFLLDLKINATPNKKTEVQSILRLRNEFGGFFGAGITVEVRELWARGIIANKVKYRVGDMDKKMTPYTLYVPLEEGVVNNPSAFQPQRELVYYEQFYTGDNTRRLQGANLDFGLEFTEGLDEIDVSAFAARIRGTDFFTTPSRFVSGAQINLSSATLVESSKTKLDLGLNAAYTFDDLKTGLTTTGIRNTVYSVNYNLRAYSNEKISLHVLGEAGMSDFVSKNDTTSLYSIDDNFVDIGIQAILKQQNLVLTASFIDIGPDFYSIGAQSKRVEFDASKSFYNRVGPDAQLRSTSLFDLSRDRGIYTFRTSDQLMAYDPRFGNVMPYGLATANRQGLRSSVEYGKLEETFNARVDAALLSEIRGQGTPELKKFKQIRASSNLNINDLIDWQKNLKLTLGYQFEETSRNGVDVERIKLRSNLIEVGIESELFENFEVLLGTKLLNARGTEYIPRIDEFNIVKDFPTKSNFDYEEILLAGGFKYTFKKGIYLTLQYHSFSSALGQNNPSDYNLDQIFALYTMNF